MNKTFEEIFFEEIDRTKSKNKHKAMVALDDITTVIGQFYPVATKLFREKFLILESVQEGFQEVPTVVRPDALLNLTKDGYLNMSTRPIEDRDIQSFLNYLKFVSGFSLIKIEAYMRELNAVA